jgi:hypothetical protein
MPGGNGTGPLGIGPMTGRKAGRCAGYGVPGYMNYNIPGQGRGQWGLGNRRGGRGRGFAWSTPEPYSYSNAVANETWLVSHLEQKARYLESGLERIRRVIAEIKNRERTD